MCWACGKLVWVWLKTTPQLSEGSTVQYQQTPVSLNALELLGMLKSKHLDATIAAEGEQSQGLVVSRSGQAKNMHK